MEFENARMTENLGEPPAGEEFIGRETSPWLTSEPCKHGGDAMKSIRK